MVKVEVKGNPLLELQRSGQSVWLDSFHRGWVISGALGKLIEEDGLRGVTVNPTIFQNAIAGSSDYDESVRELVKQGKNTEQIYESLMVEDIRMAADLFRSVYDELDGADSLVSIELPPSLAYDTEGTIREAHRFYKMIDRENIMVKVPGTRQGAKAIEELTYDGINVNVTLLFSIDDYVRVANAYINGLKRRLEDGEPVDRIASVASFFVSRIDTAVDHQLEDMISKENDVHRREELDSLIGKTAIANAKMAYQRYKEIFSDERFGELRDEGAHVQRVLWASTSTKDPRFPDVYYVENLIGPETVDTIPPHTLFAFKDHGRTHPTLEANLDNARDILQGIKQAGIDLDAVTGKLQTDGVDKFQKSVDEMNSCLSAKRNAVERSAQARQAFIIHGYRQDVDSALDSLVRQSFGRRLWEKDPSLWRQGSDGEKVIKNRLGWLNVTDLMTERCDELTQFADEVRDAGFTHAVLLGMGGSSLSPEVSRMVFGVQPGRPDLIVLDSTVPSAVLNVERQIDPARTLFIVSSKSGTTVETLSGYRYFLDKVQAVKEEKSGENFIAITDPGTPLESEARKMQFRRIYLNPPDIGGRYSALSYFGLVPAAIIGVDIEKLLGRASQMMEGTSSCVSLRDNPGIVLGTILGELALKGRNKVMLIASPEIAGFGSWVEQLIAESTGKHGTGIIPVNGDSLTNPEYYGTDKLFVYMRLASSDNRELDAKIDALEHAGQPVVRIRLDDIYDLGQEYFRWEIAIATAGALLGIDAFDEPNVKESKDNTDRLLGDFKSNGRLPEDQPVMQENGIELYCDQETKKTLDGIRSASPYLEDSLRSYIAAHLSRFQPGNYFALMGFADGSDASDGILQSMRGMIRDAFKAAVTVGYGPRFLHSIGQLYKGGPNSGIFIQFTADDARDAAIPGETYSYGVLKQAQAMGDAISLRGKGRPFIRMHIGADIADGLNRAAEVINDAILELERW